MALRFDNDFLKKLEYLHILSKRVFAGQFRAERISKKRGSGLEFADHRPYSMGDDFRHIDWRAYQRLDRLLLRMFEEEQDMPVYLFVDTSASMAEGNPSKLDYACHVAAALCYVGLAHLDRVAILTWRDRLDAETPSRRGKGQIFRIFDFLTALQPEGKTDLAESIKAFCARRKQKGVAVVVSDFLDPSGHEAGLNALRYFQHDVFLVHVTSKNDADPAVAGDIRMVDSESGEARDVELTPTLLHAYKRAWQQHIDSLQAYCAKYNIGYVRTPIEEPFEDTVLQVFRQGRFLA
jgi:uncharacterized protein (DUF58 family)